MADGSAMPVAAAALPGSLPGDDEPGSADRLSFAAFLTVALHLVVILGVTFTLADPPERAVSLEVTLARHDDQQAPKKADFAADANQLGSGDLAEVADTTTTEVSRFNDNVIREVDPVDAPPPEPEPLPERRTPTLAANAAAERSAAADPTEANPTPRTRPPAPEAALDLSREIASLQARLDSQRQLQARRPRVKRLTSLSTKSTSDAFYLESWRRKVESVGNLNYPNEARRNRLYGSLRLVVTLLPDGSLKDVRVLESSGHKVLDDAAVRIVRLAAPYAPFPDAMRREADELEIIRTWQFRQNRYSSS